MCAHMQTHLHTHLKKTHHLVTSRLEALTPVQAMLNIAAQLLSGLWSGPDSTFTKHPCHQPAGIAGDRVPTLVLVDVYTLHI